VVVAHDCESVKCMEATNGRGCDNGGERPRHRLDGGDVASYMASQGFDDVAEADRKPGDLIMFPASNGMPNHIGIVVDATHWIGCQSSTGVAKVLFTNPVWKARPHRVRRVKGLSTVAMNAGRGAVVAA
jgi:hypothetical protein